VGTEYSASNHMIYRLNNGKLQLTARIAPSAIGFYRQLFTCNGRLYNQEKNRLEQLEAML